MINYIYTLSCPLTNHVKYVGKTTNPKQRKKEHNNSGGDHRNQEKLTWMIGLKNIGLRPVFEIIEETTEAGDNEEMYWIGQFKAWGFVLFNKTSGGKGFACRHSKKTIENIKKIQSKIRSEGFDPRKGKKHSVEAKKKMSKAKLGRVFTPIVRYNMAVGKSEGVYKVYKNDVFLGEFISTPDVQKKIGFPGRSIYDLAKSGKVGVSRKTKGVRVDFYPKNLPDKD
jgi:hypothetical protein